MLMATVQTRRHMPFIEVEPGIKLFVEDSLAGSPGTFVFVHGWPLSSKVFEYQFQDLVPRGYRCIALDLRGFGDSDKPWGVYNYDVFAHDLAVVLEALEVQDAILVGHSMGGAIALHFAAKQYTRHINKLVLVSAAAPSFMQRSDFALGVEQTTIDAMIKDCLNDRISMLSKFGTSCFAKPVSPAFSRWFHTIALNASPFATLKCLEALRDADLRQDIARVKVPTLIMHGGKDTIAPFALAEVLHQGIENSKLLRFENSGHAIFYEDLAEFNQNLMDFAS